MTDPREMQAGPELDAHIAIEIFGWRWLRNKFGAKKCSLQPPFNAGEHDWQMAPWPKVESEIFDPVDGTPTTEDRFSDWMRSCIRHNRDGATELGLPKFSSDPAASAELRAKLWEMGMSEMQILIFSNRVAVRIFHRSYSTDWIEVEIKGDPRPAEYEAVAKAGLIFARERKAGAA
jgi:hypothetical protein